MEISYPLVLNVQIAQTAEEMDLYIPFNGVPGWPVDYPMD